MGLIFSGRGSSIAVLGVLPCNEQRKGLVCWFCTNAVTPPRKSFTRIRSAVRLQKEKEEDSHRFLEALVNGRLLISCQAGPCLCAFPPVFPVGLFPGRFPGGFPGGSSRSRGSPHPFPGAAGREEETPARRPGQPAASWMRVSDPTRASPLSVCLFVFVCLSPRLGQPFPQPPPCPALPPAARFAAEGGKPAGLEPSSRRQRAGGRGASHRSVGAALASPQGGPTTCGDPRRNPRPGETTPLQGNRGLGSAGRRTSVTFEGFLMSKCSPFHPPFLPHLLCSASRGSARGGCGAKGRFPSQAWGEGDLLLAGPQRTAMLLLCKPSVPGYFSGMNQPCPVSPRPLLSVTEKRPPLGQCRECSPRGE